MILDIYVGLTRDSQDLAGFLAEEGYPHVEKKEDHTFYARNGNPNKHNQFPQILHFPTITKDGDVKWENSGYNVLSEVSIAYTPDSSEEVERISEKIVTDFGGILYDSELDQFFTKKNFNNFF